MEAHDDLSSPPRPQRGRKSAASLSVVSDVRFRRPAPPASLLAEERVLWSELTEAVRPDWFNGGSQFVLELYVRLLNQSRQLAAAMAQEEPANERYLELCGLHRSVSMAACAVATKLRLTPRSTKDRYAPRAVSTVGRRPWDDDAPA